MEAPVPGDRSDAGPSVAGTASATGVRARVRRPAAVTILAIIQLLNAIVYGLLFVALIVLGSPVLDSLAGNAAAQGGAALELELVIGGAIAVVGALCVGTLSAGILLLRMRRLGWTITMLLAGLTLAASLVAWLVQGAAIEVWLLVQIVTVFYLNQRQVREAFGISGHAAGFALDRSPE